MHHVEDLMQHKVFTVSPDDLIDRVFFLLHYERIRHLPVVENNKVVGIVSDRDLYKVLGPRHRSKSIGEQKDGSLYVIPRKVKTIMHRGVETITAKSRASKAASLMAEKKISSLPVIDEKDGTLIGIITSTDILRTFSKLEKALERAERRAEKEKG